MTNIYLLSYLGGPEGPYIETHVNENFRAVRPHHIADIYIYITREKNNHQFFIYGPQYTKLALLVAIRVPWVAHTQSDWANLGSQLLSSHLYQNTYKIWKQSDKDVFNLS